MPHYESVREVILNDSPTISRQASCVGVKILKNFIIGGKLCSFLICYSRKASLSEYPLIDLVGYLPSRFHLWVIIRGKICAAKSHADYLTFLEFK